MLESVKKVVEIFSKVFFKASMSVLQAVKEKEVWSYKVPEQGRKFCKTLRLCFILSIRFVIAFSVPLFRLFLDPWKENW